MIVVTSEYKMNFIHVFQIIINDLILCLCTKYCTCCKIRYFTFWQCTWTFGFWCSTFLQYHTFVKNPKHIEFEDKLHNDTTNMLSIWIICLVYLKNHFALGGCRMAINRSWTTWYQKHHRDDHLLWFHLSSSSLACRTISNRSCSNSRALLKCTCANKGRVNYQDHWTTMTP